MLVEDLFDLSPLVEALLSDHVLALEAQIVDLRVVGAARLAEVLKVNVHNEVRRDMLAFVFTDILGTEFHLPRLDVVASLDERRIEHDAEHHLVGEACMLENNLYVALEDQALLLLLR